MILAILLVFVFETGFSLTAHELLWWSRNCGCPIWSEDYFVVDECNLISVWSTMCSHIAFPVCTLKFWAVVPALRLYWCARLLSLRLLLSEIISLSAITCLLYISCWGTPAAIIFIIHVRFCFLFSGDFFSPFMVLELLVKICSTGYIWFEISDADLLTWGDLL